MPRLRPIKRNLFAKYLLSKGCFLKRTVGGHEVYDRKGLNRPIIIQTHFKEVPINHIKSNLNTLGETLEQFHKDIERL
jgi:predicted RNA binding protein YcfA (HicA-like mRNA interferase family)